LVLQMVFKFPTFSVLMLAPLLLLASCSLSTTDTSPQSSARKNKTSLNFKPVNTKTDSDRSKGGAMPSLKQAIDQPLTPQQTEELLEEVGSNWLFGQGIGETALTIGTVVLFPPYAIAVVGNAALQMSGEEPIGLSTVLPEEEAKVWVDAYDGVTSVPGRGVAFASGEEFRDKEIARERIQNVLKN
jgi:hypothetical protein